MQFKAVSYDAIKNEVIVNLLSPIEPTDPAPEFVGKAKLCGWMIDAAKGEVTNLLLHDVKTDDIIDTLLRNRHDKSKRSVHHHFEWVTPDGLLVRHFAVTTDVVIGFLSNNIIPTLIHHRRSLYTVVEMSSNEDGTGWFEVQSGLRWLGGEGMRNPQSQFTMSHTAMVARENKAIIETAKAYLAEQLAKQGN